MDRLDWDAELRASGVPAPTPDRRAAARRAALREYSRSPRGRRSAVLLPVAAAFLLGLLCGVVLLSTRPASAPELDWERTLARQSAMFRELESMFGSSLHAVVRDADGDEIHTSNDPTFDGPVVFVRLRRANDHVDVIARSGSTIEVSLGGERLRFEVLVTGNDDVLLAGDDFVLVGSHPSDDVDFECRVGVL